MVVACDCQHVMYTLGAIYIRGVWPPQSERGDTGPVERDPAPPDGVPFQSSGSQHLTLGSRPRKCARRSVSVLVCSVISLNLTPNALTPQPPNPPVFLTSVALPAGDDLGCSWKTIIPQLACFSVLLFDFSLSSLFSLLLLLIPPTGGRQIPIPKSGPQNYPSCTLSTNHNWIELK